MMTGCHPHDHKEVKDEEEFEKFGTIPITAGLAQLIIEGQQDDGVEPAKESSTLSERSLLEKKGHTKEEINEAFRHVPDPTGILDLN
ncbi:hypothetical protein ACFX13_030757 [Malus domestica]